MNKGELINSVAKVVSSKKEAQAAVDCVLSEITGALEKNEAEAIQRTAGAQGSE